VAVLELYYGQQHDDKHAWKDLQAEQDEYSEYLTKQNKKINTLQYIPDLPRHTPTYPQFE